MYQTDIQPKCTMILMHGYGANAEDLASLAKILAIKCNTPIRVVVPQAPIQLQPGSYAWWQLDLGQLMMTVVTQGPDALFVGQKPGIAKSSSDLIKALVEHEISKFGLASERIVLAGFSQGSWLATHVALEMEQLGALVIYSGALYFPETWPKRSLAIGSSLKVLQSHGTQDSILPYVQGKKLETMFKKAGADHDFISFSGDHTIPMEAIEKTASLIEKVFQGH